MSVISSSVDKLIQIGLEYTVPPQIIGLLKERGKPWDNSESYELDQFTNFPLGDAFSTSVTQQVNWKINKVLHFIQTANEAVVCSA